MPSRNLSQSVATTYPDSATDDSVAQHQADHDVIHSVVDKLLGYASDVTLSADNLADGVVAKLMTATERSQLAQLVAGQPVGGGGLSYDTDGVPYLTPAGQTSTLGYAYDIDGVPYLVTGA